LRLFYLIGFTLLVSVIPAVAHPGIGTIELFSGMAHPFSGFDHIFAMSAVGIWASKYPGKKSLIWPLSFLISLSIGSLLGLWIGPAQFAESGFIEFGIAISIVFFGFAILLDNKISLTSGSALCVFFALFHGMAHGLECQSSITGLLYITGVVLGSLALLSSGAILYLFLLYLRRNFIFFDLKVNSSSGQRVRTGSHEHTATN